MQCRRKPAHQASIAGRSAGIAYMLKDAMGAFEPASLPALTPGWSWPVEAARLSTRITCCLPRAGCQFQLFQQMTHEIGHFRRLHHGLPNQCVEVLAQHPDMFGRVKDKINVANVDHAALRPKYRVGHRKLRQSII